MTKQELKQYRHLKSEIEQINLQLEKVRNDLIDVKSSVIDCMPKFNNKKDNSERLDKLISLEKLLNQKIDFRYNLLLCIEQAIDKLTSLEAMIVRLYYVDGLSWQQVAERLGYTDRQVHRIHGTTLKKMSYNVS